MRRGPCHGCNRDWDHHKKDCDDSKKENCCCVEEMAKQLKRHRNDFVAVFEKNAIVFGTIDDVKDDAVLKMEVFLKLYFFGDRFLPFFSLDEVFISICEIEEFATFEQARAQEIANTLQITN